MNTIETLRPGLEGVVATATSLSSVDGDAGELIIGGFPLEAFASKATFEETAFLLWTGRRPTADELTEFRALLASRRDLPPATIAVLRAAADASCAPMDALRMAAATLDIDGTATAAIDEAARITARIPTIVASYHRLSNGNEPIAARSDLGHAANYLYMMEGVQPTPARTRALETYLNTVVDHGLNASTFTARVIVSTGSDLTSAVTGAIGALKGPLHGGAPGPALDMVLEIGSAERIEEYLRQKLERGERLMGFGHRVYKVRDPRADVLAEASRALFGSDGDTSLYDLAMRVESRAVELLEEYKPGRRLQTNVEFYTALLLHGLGLPTELFTPTFAVSRTAGWLAHSLEQTREGRLIRPQSVYVGPHDDRWVPLEAH